MPQRIQRKRTKGFRLPEGCVYVGRPSVFGNPFAPAVIPGWATHSRELAVEDFGNWLAHPDVFSRNTSGGFATKPESVDARDRLLAALPQLVGHDLACWCHLSQPCHADVLLSLANPEGIAND
ncbi:DUF4326 domain-containing protein [Acrocarpospora sp. B8E8]|uniref:DUF4326 domain-containing protein n=1 Tax=Acrocarpospora sp. B8E8 TaxID=3153572 RepID=UPI00325C5FC7